jgi:Putative zinc-finger
MHRDDGMLQALLDGELDPAGAAEAHQHLEGCAACRARLEELRQDEQLLNRALPSLDHTTASVPVEVIARAARPHIRRLLLRWAAVMALIVMGAGALYALPGSPVRRWVDRLVRRTPGKTDVVPPGSLPGTMAGVALMPGDRFHIVFAPPRSGGGAGSVTITLTSDSMIDVRRIDGEGRFVAEINGLRIETDGEPAHFTMALPRTAPWIEVSAGTRRIFLKDGSRITAEARPDSLGRYILTLTRQ